MSDSLQLTPSTTALILIDLQKGILNYPTEPHSSSTVLSNAIRMAESFRKLNAQVVLVHVGYSSDGGDALNVPTDASFSGSKRPDDWMEFPKELGPNKQDIIINKKQWGGFYGTELDLQLRRRGIGTLVMGGIATNFGVESTARDAYERGYAQVFPEDGMSGLSEEAHNFAIENILPRIGRVRSTDEILEALEN
ncbi:MAG TPA: hydrolase [Balneolaceae bacterium]|nr:hydrolase [Balneolaceae bacterium]